MTDEGGTEALPIIEDWDSFWRVWGPRIAKEEGKHGWILFLLDAHEKITELNAVTARIMMGKSNTIGTQVWSAREWENCETVATEAKAWFERNVPRLSDLPEFVQFLLSAQYSNLSILVRLARDLRGMQEQHGVSSHIVERNDADGSFRVVA